MLINLISLEVALCTYLANVHSHVYYGIIFWVNSKRNILTVTFVMMFGAKYKEIKQLYQKLLLKDKQESLQKKLYNTDNLSKDIWKIVKSNKNQATNTNITLKYNDNKLISNPLEVSELFNSYFSLVSGPKTTNTLKSKFTVTTEPKISSSIFMYPTDVKEIRDIVIHLKTKDLTGWDEISSELFKRCIHPILESLVTFINKIINTGIFTEVLKLSIKPLHKHGEKNLASNYRPIALIPTFRKNRKNCTEQNG